jgi:RNA polymerase sigma factor (sigma-70 family)
MRPPPFQRLLDTYKDDVYRFLRAAVGPQGADDCWQETWLAALRGYPRLGNGANLKAWVLTIAHRKSIDHHRRAARDAIPVAALPDAPSLDGESNEELWTSVRLLPPKQRAAVVLRYVNDLTYRDIGAAMNTSADAARQNVREGLKKLREEWKS